MLYLPWRDDNVDFLGDFPDFHSHYEDKNGVILANEQKYSRNATLVTVAMHDLTEHGPPQHDWDQVAPGAVEEQARGEAEGV